MAGAVHSDVSVKQAVTMRHEIFVENHTRHMFTPFAYSSHIFVSSKLLSYKRKFNKNNSVRLIWEKNIIFYCAFVFVENK